MLELQNNHWWFCKIHLYYLKNVDKVKMNYSLYELEKIDESSSVEEMTFIFKSSNSDERFDVREFKAHKIGLVKKIKLKDGIYFGFIFNTQIDDFSEMEKVTLPIVKDYVSKRLLFKSRFKKFLLDRIEQILFERE